MPQRPGGSDGWRSNSLQNVRRGSAVFTFAFTCLFAPHALAASECEAVAVVPLEPSGISPAHARAEEERVREALGALSNVCVVPRAQSAKVLREMEGQRLPACADATCRARMAKAFGAKWLYSGTVYGFGGGRTVMLTLWNAEGTTLHRGSFASGDTVDPSSAAKSVVGMLRDARLGRSVATAGDEAQQGNVGQNEKPLWPRLAVGAAGLAALAGGVAFASASAATSERISQGATGCPGAGDEYQACFARTVRSGEEQATAANVLFGAGALLGAGAVVMFVVELP